MKKKFLLFTAFAGITSLTILSNTAGPSTSAGNVTQAGCNSGGGCHGASSSNTTASVALLDPSAPTTPVTSYTPGHVYQVVVLGGNMTAGLIKFGFQTSCVKSASTTTQAGSFSAAPASTAVRTVSSVQVVEHTTQLTGTSAGGSNIYSVRFNWTAPATGTGQVKFFTCINGVNGNGASSGDQWNSASSTYDEARVGVNTIANTISLTAFPNPTTSVLNVKIAGGKSSQYKVVIYDLLGRTMQQQNITAQETSLNTSTLAAGNYVAVVTSEAGRGVLSFVKQ